MPQLFDLVDRLRRDYRLTIPCFGHAGDGNIHVNVMCNPADADEMRRAKAAERELFRGVVALEGSISGEHGIGFAKAPYLGFELSPEVIALMKRVKLAFDPEPDSEPGEDLGTRIRFRVPAFRGSQVRSEALNAEPPHPNLKPEPLNY